MILRTSSCSTISNWLVESDQNPQTETPSHFLLAYPTILGEEGHRYVWLSERLVLQELQLKEASVLLLQTRIPQPMASLPPLFVAPLSLDPYPWWIQIL